MRDIVKCFLKIMVFANELKKLVKGEVFTDEETLNKYSTDTSLFKVMPHAVIFPKDAQDIKNIVEFINSKTIPGGSTPRNLSVTARSGGTDMSGGPLNEGIILDCTKYMNTFAVRDMEATVQPGVFYRDFEVETQKAGVLLPSYPASKSIAALGGMIANNSGGEKTLRYGQTKKYVKELKVVLSDGNEYIFSKLNKEELEKKKHQQDFEGEIYRKMYDLLENNYDIIQRARPQVSKNSAGYFLWDVYNRENFDLTQLFSGSQGTLGIITEAKLSLVKEKKYTRLGILYLRKLDSLPQIVDRVLPLEPESLETFDDSTLALALRFFPAIAKKAKGLPERSSQSGLPAEASAQAGGNLFKFALQFLPDAWAQLKLMAIADIVVLVEFAQDTEKEAEDKINELERVLKDMHGVTMHLLHEEGKAEKYWTIRRESFALLRKSVGGKRTAPFVDDLIVKPEKLPRVLPQVYKILKKYGIKATLAGHAGSGNFHIIPLMDLTKKSEREKIPKVSDEIYDLVIKEGGSITAEHNDGLMRSPYLEKMYGKEVYNLFKRTKEIFDPNNIFNPGKKVGASMEYAMEHINSNK